jgi:hypothetical protein
MQAGTDFKTTLPPAVQNGAVVETAKFEDNGAGNLSAVLDGEIQVSTEQTNALASQLNQALAAQASPATASQ